MYIRIRVRMIDRSIGRSVKNDGSWESKCSTLTEYLPPFAGQPFPRFLCRVHLSLAVSSSHRSFSCPPFTFLSRVALPPPPLPPSSFLFQMKIPRTRYTLQRFESRLVSSNWNIANRLLAISNQLFPFNP